MNQPISDVAPVDQVLITEQLAARQARAPDYAAENRALSTLAAELAGNPRRVLQRLAELVVELCHADSAGVSILEPGANGGIFRWHAAAGSLVANLGGAMPREASPCGIVIERNEVLLFSGPGRVYPSLRTVEPPIQEGLLAPWTVNGQPIGTLWAVAHTPQRQFDAEDARLLASLAQFAAAAHQTVAALADAAAVRVRLEGQVEERTHQLSASKAALREEVEQRGQIEEELRDNQATLQAAMRIETVGVLFFDLEGHIIDANPAFERLSGYSVEELRRVRHWDQLTPPEFMAATARAAGELAVTGKTAPYTKELIRKDGTRRWALFAPMRVSGAGPPSRCVEFVIDVTEREWAQAALRQSELRYRMLFESMDEGFVLAEVLYDEQRRPVDVRYLEANPAALRLARPDIVGRRLREIEPEFEPYWLDVCARVAAGGGGERLERYAGPLGTWYDFFMFRVESGGQAQVAILFQDISERKRREAQASFLAEVRDDLSRLRTTEGIIRTVGAKVATFFGVARCHIALVPYEGEAAREWIQEGIAGAGEHPAQPMVGLFDDLLCAVARAGQPLAVADTRCDARTGAAAASGIGALLAVPLAKDGQWRFLACLAHGAPRRWRDDEVELMRELATRVWLRFERARTEEELRETQLNLALVLEAAQMGTWELDLAGAGTDAAKGKDERRGEVVTRFPIVEEDRPVVDAALEQALQTGELRTEVRVHSPNGGMRWVGVRGRIYFDGSGKPVHGAGVNFDITARKRAEAALRESEARFRVLADAAPALIFEFEAGAQAVYLNQRGMDVTGLGPEQMLGGGWQSIVHPDDLDDFVQALREAIGARVSCHQRVRLRVRDGTWHWFDAYGAPLFAGGGSGGYRGHVCISIDIQEAVEAEEALQEADRRKDEFLATLAHELRNPLAPISNAVQLLRRPEGRRTADRIVEMVGRQVRHIVRLVDDLMEVSRITRGKIELAREAVTLADIVASAVETSQPAIEQGRHQLAVSLPPEPVLLQADKVRLTQVFANLLNNAAKYTEPGGRIWLSARCEPGAVVVSVRDTGIGIPAEQLPHVFEMFAQGQRRCGRDQGGLGIGLTMVRSLVELHGGSVTAASAGPQQGSEFTVRLPLAPQAPAASGAAPGEEGCALPLAGQRVLVVDDNRDAADSLALLLQADGAQVDVAYDGAGALRQAAAFGPHTILLDLGMPGMDGYEIARALRADARLAGVRLVALTGWGQESDRRRTHAAGFDHHLTKPVNVDELLALLTSGAQQG